MSRPLEFCRPEDALSAMSQPGGVAFIDVREPFEYSSARIEGSRNLPLSRVATWQDSMKSGGPVLLICRSGARARMVATRLMDAGCDEVKILEGGMMAWMKAGLPVVGTGRTVWSIERQVRLCAGVLVLAGIGLAAAVGPAGLLISGFIGAGLVISAVTDFCGMGLLLSKLPWNRT